MNRKTIARSALVALLGTPSLRAQDFVCALDDTKFEPSGLTSGESLGDSLAFDADTLVLGAGRESTGGAAYVYVRDASGWHEQARLQAADATDALGFSVGVAGDTCVAGAPGDDTHGFGAGAAYVFTRAGTTWTQAAKLLPSDGNEQRLFGISVAIDGDTIAVGSRLGDGVERFTGSVHVFVRSGSAWVEQTKLFAADGVDGEEFGWRVALDGERLAVSARRDSASRGSIYLYTRSGSTWSFEDELHALDGLGGHELGESLDLQGDRVVAGADGVDYFRGAVYVFERSSAGWSQTAKLVPEDVAGIDAFGTSVALDGDAVLGGSVFDDDGALNAGSAYVFALAGGAWSQRAKLTAWDPDIGAFFGRSIVFAGSEAVVGADEENDPGFGSGAAYSFRLLSAPSTYCRGKRNSLGCTPFIGFGGRASASGASDFRIAADDVVPGQPGLLLMSPSPAALAFHGGTLCVAAPFQRLVAGTAAASGPPPCTGRVSFDMGAHLASGTDPALTAGSVFHAQWRTRDPADPAGFGDGLTDALRVEVCP